jgi:hypothetical protein
MKKIAITTLVLCLLTFQNMFAKGNDAIQRKGFVFGISTGTGCIITSVPSNKNNTQLGHLAYNWKVGYMVNRKMTVLLQGAISTYISDGNSDSPRERLRGFEGLMPSFQYHLNNRQWVNIGIGLGMDNPVFYDVKDETEGKYYAGGFKTAISSGYEIWQRKNKSIDIQGRLSYGTSQVPEGKRNSLAFDILIGFNLY